jgi:hypothetical protein
MIHAAPLQLRYPRYCSLHDVLPEEAGKAREKLLRDASRDGRLFAGIHIQEIDRIYELPDGGFEIKSEQ